MQTCEMQTGEKYAKGAVLTFSILSSYTIAKTYQIKYQTYSFYDNIAPNLHNTIPNKHRIINVQFTTIKVKKNIAPHLHYHLH